VHVGRVTSMLRGRYDETAPVEFSLNAVGLTVTVLFLVILISDSMVASSSPGRRAVE